MTGYNRPTLRAVMELAAPHTWPASVIPVILGTVLAWSKEGLFNPGIFYSTLLVAVFLQCAVNTINDYADFIKGTDTLDNSLDPTDASMVYNNLNPKTALGIGIGFIILAGLSGIYTLTVAGWTPLLFGAVGVLIVVLYSLGRIPLSYLPLGEAVSGFTMGILITLACYYVQSLALDWQVVILSLPAFLGIGLIMMVNNTSDIEKDRESGRRTFPVLAGRIRARRVIRIALAVEVVLLLLFAVIRYREGFFVTPLFLFMTWRASKALLMGKVDAEARIVSMQSVVRSFTCINMFLIIMIVLDTVLGG